MFLQVHIDKYIIWVKIRTFGGGFILFDIYNKIWYFDKNCKIIGVRFESDCEKGY